MRRWRRARGWAAVMLALWVAAGLPAARADGAEFPKQGYFETQVTVYDRPGGQGTGIARIPPDTPLTLARPEGDGHRGYALVTWQGVTGYVRLYGLLPMPRDREDPRAGRTMYAPDVRVLRAQSLHGARVLKRMPPETPFTVTGCTKFMVKVRHAGMDGYIYGNDLRELTPDRDAEPTLNYSVREQPLLALPLAGAEALANIGQGQLVMVTGSNRGYLRLQAGDRVGYAPRDGVNAISALRDDVMFVHAQAETPLYEGPDAATARAGALNAGELYRVEAQAGEFLQVRPSQRFVRVADVQALVLTAFARPRLGSVQQATALAALPGGEAGGAELLPGRLYTFAARTGSWWYIDDGQVKGFVAARALHALPERAEEMNRTWAVYLGDQVFLPGASQPQPVSRGGLVQLAQMLGAWFRTQEGAYVHASQVRIIGSDAPVTPHTVTAGPGLALLSLPDRALAQTLMDIPEGAELHVTGFSRCYLLVTVGGMTGYVEGRTLRTHETRYLPTQERPGHVGILVDKSDFSVSLYELDESGARSGAPILTRVAALGKRTTPTPAGSYVLGRKQRWVRFAHTQAPHGIHYLPGRYVHGIPCYGQDEARAASWGLNQLGTAASGGCVRVSFDMAAYLYFNCPSYTTIMEVTNGTPKARPAVAAAPVPAGERPVPAGAPAPHGG